MQKRVQKNLPNLPPAHALGGLVVSTRSFVIEHSHFTIFPLSNYARFVVRIQLYEHHGLTLENAILPF